MNLYFMRHGRTNYNDLAICNDDPQQDAHLSELGIQQAQAAAEQLREVKLERIIVTPLPRTRQTAEYVNRYHGLEIETHAGIGDLRSGFEGLAVADYFAAVAHDPLHARVNGGESVLDHKQPIEKFIRWLKQQPQDSILVVAHEETLRVFFAHFEGDVADAEMRDHHFDNCQILNYSIAR